MSKKYHPLLRLLHWVMALLVITTIFMGWLMEYMEESIGEDNPTRLVLYDLHKSLGMTVLILVTLRIVIRMRTYVPPLPITIQPLIGKIAKLSHYAFYALMVITPLVGYAMSDSFGKGVKLFGIALPKMLPDNKELGENLADLHGVLAYTLLVLIVIHIAAAIWHRFFDKPENNTLKRML